MQLDLFVQIDERVALEWIRDNGITADADVILLLQKAYIAGARYAGDSLIMQLQEQLASRDGGRYDVLRQEKRGVLLSTN